MFPWEHLPVHSLRGHGTMTGSVPAEADAAKDNAVHKLELSDPAKDTGDLKQEEAAPRFSLWRFAQFFGTGLLAAVAYLDPGKYLPQLLSGELMQP